MTVKKKKDSAEKAVKEVLIETLPLTEKQLELWSQHMAAVNNQYTAYMSAYNAKLQFEELVLDFHGFKIANLESPVDVNLKTGKMILKIYADEDNKQTKPKRRNTSQ